MESKLYVGNLPYQATEDELRALFSQAGQIQEVAMIMDRDTRQSKGFGFVEMATQAEAENAIKLFNDYEWEGRHLMVNKARPKTESFGRGGRGGSGSRRY